MKGKIYACLLIFLALFSTAWMADIYVKKITNVYKYNIYQIDSNPFLLNFGVDFKQVGADKHNPFKPREYLRKQHVHRE